ncbi:MAG TPA: hypothetical protein VHG08_08625 [Longimicrobium sp.]|nr:hypothetical protein [Longimicrobium sp.]
MRLRTPIPILPALLALAACERGGTGSDAGGEYLAVLESPNGAEGAAAIELTGPGIESVTSTSGQLFATSSGNTTRVVLVRQTAGDIEFKVTMARGQQPPAARVVEVADGSDQPRASVSGYRVTFDR